MVVARKASAVRTLFGHSQNSEDMASWQSAWFFMPHLHTISWSASTSAFPDPQTIYPRGDNRNGVPNQVVNIAISLEWDYEYERKIGNEFHTGRLYHGKLAEHITSFRCTAADEDGDTKIFCRRAMPKCCSIELRASMVEISPVSMMLKHLDVCGSTSIYFLGNPLYVKVGLGRLPMTMLNLTTQGEMKLELGDQREVHPCDMRLAAKSLQAPDIGKLLSSTLTALSVHIKDPIHSLLDLSSLPHGSRSSSCIDESGYQLHWSA